MDVQKYKVKFTGKAAGSVLLTLAAALALWLFIAANHRKEAIEDISKSLETINSYKTAQISAWLDDHDREALRLSRHPFLGEIISAELAKPGSRRSVLAAWLKEHTEQKRYASMAFLSLKGTIIAATPDYLVETKQEFKEHLGLALKTATAQVTDLYLDTSGLPRIAMFSPIPAGGRGGKPVCMLVTRINLENRFYPILKAAPLFFTEAETLLVRKEGESALFLNPLEHRNDAALKFTRPLSEERLPAAAALRGITGFFQGVDYHGVKVFSAIGPVPGTNWAVITKVNRDTVIAPAKSKEQLYLAMILLGAALLYFLVYAAIRARRHAAEAALEESRHLLTETESERQKIERIFTEFMEHSPVYVFFKDKDLRALHLSRNFEAMLGRPLKELLGRNMDELFPSDLAKSMIEDDKRIISEGKEVVVDEELNGRFYRTIKFPIKIEGSPAYLAGYTIDVTEGKLTEKERLSHLHFLESLDRVNRAIQGAEDLEKMMNGVLTAVLDIFDCDRAWLFYPCDPDAPSFRVPMEVTRPEYPGAGILNTDIPMPPDMARNLREALESPEPVTYTLGTEKDVNKVSAEQFGVKALMMTALYPNVGKPWVFGIHQCSSPRVWTPEEMRLQQEIGRRLADSLSSLLSYREVRVSEQNLKEAQRLAGLGNWTMDLAGNKFSWSDEVHRIFETDPGGFEPSYEAFLDAIHPEDRDYVDKAYTDSVKNRSRYDIMHRLRMKDGRIKYVRECCETFYARDGRPFASRGMILDLTDMKLAELKLEKLNQDLMASKQEMENFLYITSHDLRTPLVNIQGFTQNLENYLRELAEELSPARLGRPVNEAVSRLTGKEIPGALKFVLESSHKMDSLISSLLKVARLGRVEMKPRNLEMNDLLKKIVNSTFYQLEAAGAAAKMGVLPPCKADPDAVSQIFSNLLENAIKYRAEGRALSVSITGEASGDRVLYKVADNGSGIAAKDLGRIWDIFYRGAGAGEGEGIGLTVVKYMAEKNGGSVKAESEEGRGTVFYLELPAAGGTK